MSTKLNPRSVWLLKYMNALPHKGMASHHALPCNIPNGSHPTMMTMRGLQRRGLVSEPKPYLFYLTPAGILEAERAQSDREKESRKS